MINYLLNHFEHSIMQPNQQEEEREESQREPPGEPPGEPPEEGQHEGNFDFSSLKATDLKGYWLGSTEEAIRRFQDSYASLQREQSKVVEHLKIFQENESRYRLSSLRQIKFINDDRQIYRKFIASSRRTVEGLHPILILNILSYTSGNVLLGLAKVRRVSKIFDIVYKNGAVREFFGAKDLGERTMCLEEQDRFCKRYVNFERTMRYYKQIQYTQEIPQNSFKEDLTEAVKFINEIHRRVYRLNNPEMHYFSLVNRFMSRERLVIGLSALSLTLLALIRKEAIVAFSNYLALNPLQRKKEEITKTKLGLVLRVVEDEYYRDSLVVNTKISNYLQEMHELCFAVFIGQPTSKCVNIRSAALFDLLFYRARAEEQSFFRRQVELSERSLSLNGVQFTFNGQFTSCICTQISSTALIQYDMAGYQIPAVLDGTVFGCSHVFRGGEDTYVVLICR